MANQREGSSGLEWRVVVSDGSSQELVPQTGWTRRAWTGVLGLILKLKSTFLKWVKKIWKLGVDDPRRVAHCFKVGMALTLVSFFYYLRPLYNGVGGTAMWAVMTVVVVFEYTVGATLSKGLNRGMATLLAGFLAISIHWIANQMGDKADPVIRSTAVFLLAASATFTRFIPTIKARFDYGVTVFILTFSLVTVSGYRVDELFMLARRRLCTIAVGGSICMFTSMLICPIWAGEELHCLITRNMEKLANSLDGCMAEYFKELGTGNSEEDHCQTLESYKCVLNSKAAEESLANFARWEPAHGRFSFRHPWKQYLMIGLAMRYCAYSVEALNASINSEIKTPEFIKYHLRDACMRVSSHSSNVLKDLAITTKTMRKSSNIDFLVGEMNMAVEDLQNALRHFPHQLTPSPMEATEKGRTQPISLTSVRLIEAIPLASVSSLLIGTAARVKGVSDEVEKLVGLANFKPALEDKPRKNQATTNPPQEQKGQEAMKALQQV